jgi:hypothetical protein
LLHDGGVSGIPENYMPIKELKDNLMLIDPQLSILAEYL